MSQAEFWIAVWLIIITIGWVGHRIETGLKIIVGQLMHFEAVKRGEIEKVQTDHAIHEDMKRRRSSG